MEASEPHLRSVTEREGASEAAEKWAAKDFASCTTVVEALKKELTTKTVRTHEEVAVEIEQDFMTRHGEMLTQLEDLVKELAMIE